MKTRGLWLGFALAVAGWPCSGQTPDTSAAKPAATATKSTEKPRDASATEKKKPKKVWTNEELSSVEGGVSVVGSSENSPAPEKSGGAERNTAAGSLKDQQIKNYRGQIQQLRAQMDAADKRIAQLKNFKGENSAPSGGINPNQGYDMVPPDEQVKQLEEKKKQLQAKIDDIEVEARKAGIEPGDLR